jgi:hypothetical protein
MTALQGQTLTVITHNPKAGFMQMTAGSAMFAAVGAVAAGVESMALVDKHGLVSPSLRVAEDLTPVLQDRFKASATNPVADLDDKATNEKQIAALAGNKGLVLEVRQLGWTSIYFPFDWSHYGIAFSAEARVIDASTGKVVAQAGCTVEAKKENAPTYDELYANNAAVLKAKSQEAADECAGQMSRLLFRS